MNWAKVGDRHYKKPGWELFVMHHGWALVKEGDTGGRILRSTKWDKVADAKREADKMINEIETRYI